MSQTDKQKQSEQATHGGARIASRWLAASKRGRLEDVQDDARRDLVVSGDLARAFAVVVHVDTWAAAEDAIELVVFGEGGDGLPSEPLARVYLSNSTPTPARVLLVCEQGYRSYLFRYYLKSTTARARVIVQAAEGRGASCLEQDARTLALPAVPAAAWPVLDNDPAGVVQPQTIVGNAGLAGWTGALWERIASGVSALATTAAGLLAVLPWARYTTGRSARSVGGFGPFESTKYGDVGVCASEPKDHSVIVPSDVTALDYPAGLYVGTGGNVTGRLKDSVGSVTYANVPSGAYLRGHWVRVDAATTATNIVGLKE